MTTHNLSFNISKDMSAFNIQLSFKLNIEPPENMYTFNIQPSLNVEPQENNSILQPIKQKNEKYQEQNNEQLIQILEAKKDILLEYVSEEDLDEVQKRFDEINVEDTIVSGIKFSKCGETLQESLLVQ